MMALFSRLSRVEVLGALLLVLLTTFAFAKEEDKKKKAAEVDYITLAAILIKDGHHERALRTLENVDITQEGVDLIRYYTLSGLGHLGINDLAGARDAFYQAIEKGQTENVVYVYLAQAHYGLQEYPETLKVIAQINDDNLRAYPSLLEMKAQSHWLLQQYEPAWEAVQKGQSYFPNDFRFLRRLTFYAIELEMYRLAADIGRDYLERSQAKAEDYVAIGNALRMSHQYDDAARILEAARLRYPQNETIIKVLAHTYLDQGMVNTAAALLEQAALINPLFIGEAAELYKRAGRWHRALAMNPQIGDTETRLKQRLAILLGLKQYEKVVNMESALYRGRLLGDQNIRYALAYAAFSIGAYATMEKHLEFIKEPSLFKKAVELRRLMQECQEEAWKCAPV